MWQSFKNVYHLFVAIAANFFYGFPSKKLTVIGITGTDGKTTTVSLIYHILKTSGRKASLVSSVGAIIGGKEYDVGFHVTNPSSLPLQRFIKRASEVSDYLVLEVTSHGLDQYRVYGVEFKIGVITNITHEHLDYHKTYDNYVKTKAKLLKMAKVAVVNKDDESYNLIFNLKSKILNRKWVTYGMEEDADINPKGFPFKTKLFGEFNKHNILAAIAACKELGVSDKDIKKSVESFEAPLGREEIVYSNGFLVMVDFAHTPNSFQQILSSLRPKVKGRLIHVFGCAGERDYKKRPVMGKISSRYSDVMILTAEDPRSESLDKIIDEIESGVQKNRKIEIQKILDREKAIIKAIQMAKKGDCVVITGKSHEKSMNYGKGEELWDEFEAVRKALKLT